MCYFLFNISFIDSVFFLMLRRPPISTRTHTLFPYTTLFRSTRTAAQCAIHQPAAGPVSVSGGGRTRSEEHTSELQSLMRNSYAVFCWKKKIDVQTGFEQNDVRCEVYNVGQPQKLNIHR